MAEAPGGDVIRLHPVVGREAVRRSLARAHREGALPHALLLHGARGVGKLRLALWTAQLRACEAPGDDGPCDECRGCRLALGLEHPDVHLYLPVARPTGIGGRERLAEALESARAEAISSLRERPLRPPETGEVRGLYLGTIQNLRRKALMPPAMAREQTFVVAEAELLVPQESSPEAANALLKLLEEPPSSTRFVLTSSEPGRLLPTIRSRSVPLHMAPLPTETVSSFLVERAGADPEAAERAAELSHGSIGRALGFLPEGDEVGPLESLRATALRLVEAALFAGRGAEWALALSFPSSGARTLTELLGFVEEWLRDLAAVAAGAEAHVLNRDQLATLRGLARTSGVEAPDAAAAVAAVVEARELAGGNVNPQLLVARLMRRVRRTLRPFRVPAAPGAA